MALFSPKVNVVQSPLKGFTEPIKLPGLEISPLTPAAAVNLPETSTQGDEKYPISAAERARRLAVPKEIPKVSELVEPKSGISATLVERGSRYGLFKSHASVTQAYKVQTAHALKASGVILSADQQEALDMIHHKIGRIVNGDPNYADSWIDIAGYATLISDRLDKKGEYAQPSQQ